MAKKKQFSHKHGLNKGLQLLMAAYDEIRNEEKSLGTNLNQYYTKREIEALKSAKKNIISAGFKLEGIVGV